MRNPTIGALVNTFWCSLSGASRICNSSKIVLVFWNAGLYVMLKVSLFSSGWLCSFSNNSFLGIYRAFNISCLTTLSVYPCSCNQCFNSLNLWSNSIKMQNLAVRVLFLQWYGWHDEESNYWRVSRFYIKICNNLSIPHYNFYI